MKNNKPYRVKKVGEKVVINEQYSNYNPIILTQDECGELINDIAKLYDIKVVFI